MRSEDCMPRLAFIRYLYTGGVDQSHRPWPLSTSALLTFHDSIELFLQLASEHLNAGATKRTEFEQYFALLDAALPGAKLAGKAAMVRLNNARVGLKHYGNRPSQGDIESYRSAVTSFFEDNTPLVFGVDFGTISMVDLVQSANAQASLREAADLMEQSRYDEALQKVAAAFAHLTRDYEQSKRGGRWRSPFFFGQSLTFESAFSLGLRGDKLGTFVDKVKESVEALQGAVRILSLGLDYRRYSKFAWLTPHTAWMAGGNLHVTGVPHPPVSEEDCRFCFDFVIEAAMRLQEFDYELEDPWRAQMQQMQAQQAAQALQEAQAQPQEGQQ